MAKIWIEKNNQKDIEIAWSELSSTEEAEIVNSIDEHWEDLNRMIDRVFEGEKVRIKKLK